MRYHPETPLRAVITGIDGAGKSTTASLIIENMGIGYRIVKPGPSRPVYTIIGGEKQYHYQIIVGLIDRLHILADRTKRPELIGVVNALNVCLNGRIIEPSLVKKYQPDLVLGARDFYADPAVYAEVYQPTLAKKSISERVDFLRAVTGAPFRHLIFFLTVPAEEAIIRIERRIAREKTIPGSSEREKWRHIHEVPETLSRLQHEYYAVLQELQSRSPVQIYEINTQSVPQPQVVNIITDTIKRFIGDGVISRDSHWYQINSETVETLVLSNCT